MGTESSIGKELNLGLNNRLKRDFFLRDAFLVATQLLGKILIYRKNKALLAGKIVETEAYLGIKDKASHSYRGKKTERTKILYEEGGLLYPYTIYGIYTCCNIVSNIAGIPESVFIRALEPIEGIEIMKKNSPKVKTIKALTNGPCRWTRSFGIKKSLYGCKVYGSNLYIQDPPERQKRIDIVKTKRIGIDYAGSDADRNLRFYIKNNPYVSKRRR